MFRAYAYTYTAATFAAYSTTSRCLRGTRAATPRIPRVQVHVQITMRVIRRGNDARGLDGTALSRLGDNDTVLYERIGNTSLRDASRRSTPAPGKDQGSA